MNVDRVGAALLFAFVAGSIIWAIREAHRAPVLDDLTLTTRPRANHTPIVDWLDGTNTPIADQLEVEMFRDELADDDLTALWFGDER